MCICILIFPNSSPVLHCICVFLQICGVWKNLAKPLMRQLQSEQMHISMTTSTGRREEVAGKIIKHRALFAGETARGLLMRVLSVQFLVVCQLCLVYVIQKRLRHMLKWVGRSHVCMLLCMFILSRNVQFNADLRGGECRNGRHRHADTEWQWEQPPLHPRLAGSHQTQRKRLERKRGRGHWGRYMDYKYRTLSK